MKKNTTKSHAPFNKAFCALADQLGFPEGEDTNKYLPSGTYGGARPSITWIDDTCFRENAEFFRTVSEKARAAGFTKSMESTMETSEDGARIIDIFTFTLMGEEMRLIVEERIGYHSRCTVSLHVALATPPNTLNFQEV